MRDTKEQRNMVQGKRVSPEIDPKEMKVYELPDKDFTITITEMITKLKEMMNEQNEKMNGVLVIVFIAETHLTPTV